MKIPTIKKTILDKIVDIIIAPEIVEFLNQTIIKHPILILNYWSFVHLLAGVLFFSFISKNIKLWLAINIVFEIIEFALGIGGNPLFVEEAIDITWDIILSMAGFWTTKKITMKWEEKHKPKKTKRKTKK